MQPNSNATSFNASLYTYPPIYINLHNYAFDIKETNIISLSDSKTSVQVQIKILYVGIP
jgi:hypothetical protein